MKPIGFGWRPGTRVPGLCLFVVVLALLARPSSVAAQTAIDTKQRFVTALIEFLGAVAGTYGDEGPRLTASVEQMDAGLRRWDMAVRSYVDAVAAQMQNTSPAVAAGLHVAGGAVLLERGWLDEAIREFTAAAVLDPRRPDIPIFRGLAHDLANQGERAAAAFHDAWSLDRGNPVPAYLFVRSAKQVSADERSRVVETVAAFLKRSAGAEPQREAPFITVALLEEAGRQAPVFPPARYVEAFDALERRQYEDAVARFRRAAQADPLVSDPAVASQPLRAGIVALREGRTARAIDLLTSAADSNAGSSELRRILATAFWFDGQPARSLDALDAAIRLSPDDERSRVLMADVLIEDKQWLRAERTLQETVARMANSGQAHWRLGQLYQILHRDADARRELERAAACHPVAGAPQLYAAIARLYASQPDLDAAIDWESRRVGAAPNDPEAHKSLGSAYRSAGRDEEALLEFSIAAAIDRRDADALVAIGQLHLAAGRFAEAAGALRQAVALGPSRYDARYNLGSALLRAGQDEEGRAELEVARELQAVHVANQRRTFDLNSVKIEAALQTDQGRHAEAARLWQQVVEREPDVASNYQSLGRSFADAAEHDRAIEAFARAATLSSDADIHLELAAEYAKTGRRDDSARERALYQQMKEEQLRQLGISR